MHTKLLKICLAITLATTSPQGIAFSKIIFFGDSLTDSGYYKGIFDSNQTLNSKINSEQMMSLSELSPTGKEKFESSNLTGLMVNGGPAFTTNPDLVWPQIIALHYGLTADPAWGLKSEENDGNFIEVVKDGSNYAIGGARVSLPSVILTEVRPVKEQMDYYIKNHVNMDSNAAYFVWAGANDVLANMKAQSAGLSDPDPIIVKKTLNSIITIMENEAIALGGAIHKFNTKGKRSTIAVFTLPDLGKTPLVLSESQKIPSYLWSEVTQKFNNKLRGLLISESGATDNQVIIIDTYAFFNRILSESDKYGFTNTTEPACKDLLLGLALFCTPENYHPGDNVKYLFSDDIHPGGGLHKLIAEYTIQQLDTLNSK